MPWRFNVAKLEARIRELEIKNTVHEHVLRLRQEYIEELVRLCLAHGIISRGKACGYLGILRHELDDWLEGGENG